MSYNGSGTFSINSAGQPVITGTVISSTAFNALTADLATGLSTAITKDGQTTTTSRILFAQGISSTLVTDATSATTGSIITAGGISTQKALWVGTTSNFAGTITAAAANFSGAVVITANNALKITATNPIIRFDQTGTGAVVHRLQAQVVAAGDIGFYNETSAATPFYITSGDVNTFSTAMSYGGVTLSNSVTGTGSMVLSASPVLTGLLKINNGSGNSPGGSLWIEDNNGITYSPTVENTPTSTIKNETGGANRVVTFRLSARDSGGGLSNWNISSVASGSNLGSLTFQNGANERARIDAGGRFLGGRTTAVTPSGTTITGCFASGVSATNGTNSVCMGSNTITFDDSFLFINNAAGVGVYLANGGTTWTANSDREMKHKIEALNAHDILRAVGDEAAKNGESIAVLYDWKENSDRREAGSIAQNWLVALPAIVEASNPEKLGLMYDRMGAIAAQGVYEQLAINAALKARLAALENK